MLSDTNEGMDRICSNPVDTSLGDFLRQEEENKEVDEGDGESDETLVNSDDSRMNKEHDNGTLENGEHTLEHLLRKKGVTKPHGKRTAARS